MWYIYLYCFLLAAVSVALVRERRDPYRTLLWMATMLLLPGLGLLVFLLIGKDPRSMRLTDSQTRQALNVHRPAGVLPPSDPSQRKMVQLLASADGSRLYDGNRMDFYTEFQPLFNVLMADIQAAKCHVHVEFFKIEDDEVGRALGSLLIAKAQEGVEVRLIYDHAANLGVRSSFYRWLRRGGVEVASFQPLVPSLLRRNANNRNHRKIVVVDGGISYTGGFNIALRYRDGICTGIWRDTFVRIVGPASSDLQRIFLCDWQCATGKTLAESRYFVSAEASAHGALLQMVANDPWGSCNAVKMALLQMISDSREYLYLQSPYLIPDTTLLAALKNAAMGGVDVRIMLPAQPDKGVLVQWASHSYFEELLDSGVRIYLYQKGYMHAKTMVCDGITATVGSTNIDIRSLELDFEVACFVYSEKEVERLRDIFLDDERDCTRVDAADWRLRGSRNRAKESFARLFAPLL